MSATYQTPAFQLLQQKVDTITGDAKPLTNLGIKTVGDLLRHVPRRYIPSAGLSDLSTLRVGQEASVIAQVASSTVHKTASQRWRLNIVLTDQSKFQVSASFFGKPHYVEYWAKTLTVGARGIFFGKVSEFNGRMQFTHPQFAILEGGKVGATDTVKTGSKPRLDKNREAMKQVLSRSGLVGLYPASGKFPTWRVAAVEHLALDYLKTIPEPFPDWVIEAAGVLGWVQAFEEVHNPDTMEQTEKGLYRLQFDEAFATQLAMARRRQIAAKVPARSFQTRDDGLLAKFDSKLPFTLTKGQKQVGEEIFADIAQTEPMQRLLQGEVGSGKTLVALRAMLAVVDGDGQTVLLAPTEVLAAQHAATLTKMLGDMVGDGVLDAQPDTTRVWLLTGSMSAARRRNVLNEIATGVPGLIVGTHAVLGAQVQIPNLGLVVVDEQHRFGVQQRSQLTASKNLRPHMLVMTATPIPRSIAMTIFGDLDVSVLDEIPAGRSEVSTVVVDAVNQPAWVARAWTRILEEVAQGRQAFIVAPKIAAETKGGANTKNRTANLPGTVAALYEYLSQGPLADIKIARLHGQMNAEDKDLVMQDFAEGKIDVLISTTVIEVGVDVPNASMMVIVDAQNFGISQLHQLRGRIGRGQHPGLCLLLAQAEPDSAAWQRLQAVAQTRDGFALAEVDLEQRKEGDVLGQSQSGSQSSLRLLRVLEHADIIDAARQIALKAIEQDPGLTHPGLADAVAAVEEQAANDLWEAAN